MIKLSNLNKDFYKPGEVANMLNLSTRTIQNYANQEKLNQVWTSTNRRLITKDSIIEFAQYNDLLIDDLKDKKYDVIYARVSTSKQQQNGDLDRQINYLKVYASDKNPINLNVISDVASGLNDNRKGLNQLIDLILNNEVNRIFISYKDRLTRFGFNYLEKICKKYNTEIIIVSSEDYNKTSQEELAEDIISIIHSFSGKLYGVRKKVKKDIEKELQ